MTPDVVKLFQFLEAKEGKPVPLRLKLLNPDTFKITKDELNVDGSLSLSKTNITSLPDGLRVSKNMYLDNCSSLESLPDGLNVGWNLYLTGCTSLRSLPDGLNVGETLILTGCTALKLLPNELNVGWCLYLKNTPLAKMYSADEIRDIIKSKGGYVKKAIYI